MPSSATPTSAISTLSLHDALPIYLHWLPVAGWEPGSVRHLVLPVIALCLPPLCIIARMTRGSMLEVLRSQYIRTAFAKGLPLRIVKIGRAHVRTPVTQ